MPVVQDAPVVRTRLGAYIRACGGSDILEFNSDREAIAAAQKLREKDLTLSVEARYTRVFIRAQKEPS
jgi:hypothetical protein